MGRPTTYTPELAKYVCKMIATHACGLRKLKSLYPDLPQPSTIYEWLYDQPSFSEQYLEARRYQASVLADNLLDLPSEIKSFEDKEGNERIDSGILGKAKLEYEVIKWHAGKMAPRIFGDKQVIEQTTAENENLKQELAELREKLAEKNQAEY